jgi:hypothetical protein
VLQNFVGALPDLGVLRTDGSDDEAAWFLSAGHLDVCNHTERARRVAPPLVISGGRFESTDSLRGLESNLRIGGTAEAGPFPFAPRRTLWGVSCGRRTADSSLCSE